MKLRSRNILVLIVLLRLSTNLQSQVNFSRIDYDLKFDDPFFKEQKWTYPWFTFKNEKGEFETALADSLGNPYYDTTHIPLNANCHTNYGYDHVVGFCKAKMKGDTLLIFLNDFSASTNDNYFIYCYRGKFTAKFSTTFIFPVDESAVTWTIGKQKLILNSTKMEKGQMIKGFINLEFIEKWKQNLKNEPYEQETKFYLTGPFRFIVE